MKPLRLSAKPKDSGELQDLFLLAARQSQTAVALFLMNGICLRGQIIGFDRYVVVLDGDKGQHLIYKHAISTIGPSTNATSKPASTYR